MAKQIRASWETSFQVAYLSTEITLYMGVCLLNAPGGRRKWNMQMYASCYCTFICLRECVCSVSGPFMSIYKNVLVVHSCPVVV